MESRAFAERSIVRRGADGFFSATTMMPAKKRPTWYTKRRDAKVLLEKYPSQSVIGGRGYSATWFHPVVAQGLAEYLSPELGEFIKQWIAEEPEAAPQVLSAPSDTSDSDDVLPAVQVEVTPTAESPPSAVVPELVDLPGDLASLIGITNLPKVRKVPGEKKWVLSDIGGAFLEKTNHDAAQDLRRTIVTFPSLGTKCSQVLFECNGRQPVSCRVGDLATVIEYIFLLPGATAARIRAEAARLLVRYLGGDLSLIKEVQEIRHVQEHLKEVDPDNWLRAFGVAVESDTSRTLRTYLKPPELAIPQRQYDLYVMRVTEDGGRTFFWKIGKSDDPLQRATQLLSEARRIRGKEWTHMVVAIYQGHGDMESLVHTDLESLRISGTVEYFHNCDDFLEKVHAVVERLLPVQLEKQRQKLRRATEVIEEAGTYPPPPSRKRTREEAPIDLDIAELDAKAVAASERERAFQTILDLAKAGSEIALTTIVARIC